MTYDRKHFCGEHCVCPEHQTQLLWAPRENEHACADPVCRYAHGYESALVVELGKYPREKLGVWPTDCR